MSKRERVLAALAGAVVDRVPISLWNHPVTDPRRGDELAAVMIDYQREYDWDFVKMMPNGSYYPEALGCTLTPPAGPYAINGIADSPIKRPEDWERLPILDPHQGWLAEHLKSIRLVREALGPDILIVESIFSPLTVAHKMSISVPFEESLGNHRASLEVGLSSIAEGSKRFAEAALAAGADGFFFATQEANRDTLSEDDFLALGKPYDLEILRSVEGRCAFNLMHLCKLNVMADLVADYPVHAINWETGGGNPSLLDARRIWPYALVGGIERSGTLVHGTPEDVAAEVRRAIDEAGGRKLILGAGCVVASARKDENLHAARRAVESARP
jgi:uroporphyrinogen decarboxylase